MISFRQYLIEYTLLLEDKKQEYINKWLKVHNDHPLVKNNPERASGLIAYARSFGQTVDEHHFLTRQLLDGTYKPDEDDPTIQMTLGKWRRGKRQNLVKGSLKDHTHDSVSKLFSDIPELQIKSTVQARGMDELAKYHIGEIEHPQHGTLQVHHVHHSDVKDFEEYKRISGALRKTCQGGYTWCVLPKENDSGPNHLKGYSRGSGIFFYTNQEGTPVLSHGYTDRGIVDPGNKVVDGEEGKQVFGETIKLLSGEKKVSHILAGRNEQYVNSDQLQSAVEDPSFGNDPEHISAALRSSDESIARAAVEHRNFGNGEDEEYFNIALTSPHESVALKAAQHPKFGNRRDHITSALRSPHESIQTAAVERLNRDQAIWRKFFRRNPRRDWDDHISYALRSPHESIASAAVNRPNFGNDPNHISHALRSPHESIARAAVEHRNFGNHPEHISAALESDHESIARAAVEHRNFGNGEGHISVALRSDHESIQTAAVEHRNFGNDPEHISAALRSRHESIARAAVEHRNFGNDPEHIRAALGSSDESIARAAVEHRNFGNGEGHLSAALRSDHESIQTAAVNHSNFISGWNPFERINYALKSPYESVRQLAWQKASRLSIYSKAPPEQISAYMADHR